MSVAQSDFEDDDSEFAALVRRFAAAPDVPLGDSVALQPGTVIADAYRVEAIVGRGGMGVVARATDLRLDRDVALKVLARKPDETGLDVLRAEAQAMALLAHPNVVEVFEVGTHDGQLFIAMEFLSGGTAQQWQKGRSRTEIVRKYIEAGRGLAAAHRADLVHRDFKPANVLMDADGRPRVADFGLVLQLSLPQAETLRDYRDVDATSPANVRCGVSLHAIAGTPGYMAPEQAAGKGADATADQYAFCAALAEALTGVPAIERDHKVPLPRHTGPKALRTAIERGLAHVSTDRHANLEALLSALQATLRPRRTVWWVGGGLLGLVGAALVTAPSDDRACLDQAQMTADAWRDGLSTADDPVLTRYADGWLEQRRALCRLGVSTPHRDPAMHCLKVRRDALAAVLDVVGTEAGAVATTETPAPLPPLKHCAVDWFANAAIPEPDASIAAAVAEVESDIARASVHVWSGQRGQALALARAARLRAESIGYGRALVKASLAVGDALLEGGDLGASATECERAFHLARADSDDESALEASVSLVQAYIGLGELDTADRWAGHAEVAFARLGGHPTLEVSLLASLGNLRLEQGRYQEAIRHQERVLALLPQEGDLVRRAKSHNNLGAALYSRGDQRLAAVQFEHALALYRAERGVEHPDNTHTMANLAWAWMALGEAERAAPLIDDAIAILRTQEVFDAHGMATLLSHRGSVLCGRGDHTGAQKSYDEALAIVAEHLGDAHPTMGILLQNSASEWHDLGNKPRALASYQEAVRVFELAKGPEDEDLALALSNLAGLLLAMDRAREALEPSARAIQIFDGRGKQDRPELVAALSVRAEVLLEVGQAESALAAARRAAGIAERSEASEAEKAELAELLERIEAKR